MPKPQAPLRDLATCRRRTDSTSRTLKSVTCAGATRFSQPDSMPSAVPTQLGDAWLAATKGMQRPYGKPLLMRSGSVSRTRTDGIDPATRMENGRPAGTGEATCPGQLLRMHGIDWVWLWVRAL